MADFIAPNYPWKVYQIKGTAGGALNRIEYICEAEPGVATSAAQWRLKKLVYDSAGFMTHILWASGDRKFDKVADNYASYTYS